LPSPEARNISFPNLTLLFVFEDLLLVNDKGIQSVLNDNVLTRLGEMMSTFIVRADFLELGVDIRVGGTKGSQSGLKGCS
jgi:hypothetical protein